MNWDKIAGNWKQANGQMKQSWAKLTDDGLAYIEGSRDKMLGKVHERYGTPRMAATAPSR